MLQRPDGASGFKGRDSPLIDGCRESDISLLGFSVETLTASKRRTVGQGSKGQERPLVQGSVQVERELSKSCEG